MVWFKVDDKLHDHRKARAAGKAAMGVWVLAGSWSSDHGTGGFVPADVLPRWGTRADANKLVAVGLWFPAEHDGEKGWRFHEWTDRNPDADSVAAIRSSKSGAGSLGNHRRWHEKRGVTVDGCEHCVPASDSQTNRTVRSVRESVATRPAPAPVPDAAAAACDAIAQTLPPPLEILRSALEARKLVVRWDGLKAAQIAEIEQLVAEHGDGPLVAQALREFRPDKPIVFAQGWLPGWRQLRKPGDLAAVPDDPCTEPGHTGTTRHCVQCASERKAAR